MENMFGNTLETWGTIKTHWELKRNILRTHLEPGENEKKSFTYYVTCSTPWLSLITHTQRPASQSHCEVVPLNDHLCISCGPQYVPQVPNVFPIVTHFYPISFALSFILCNLYSQPNKGVFWDCPRLHYILA
jgi:hypothetical protein